VNALFRPACFEPNFNLVNADQGGDTENLLIPEGTKMSHFIEWVRKLPENQPPHWLGLPRNAEKLLMASRGREMLSKVRKMSSLSGGMCSILKKNRGRSGGGIFGRCSEG
jgi:dynein heavy chain 1